MGYRRRCIALAFVVGLLAGPVEAVVAPESFLGLAAAAPASAPTAINPAPVVSEVLTPGPTAAPSSITTDTVWGPVGSPYVVSGVVKVASAASLTLLPGTVVKLNGQTSRIVVQGQLLSLGTATDPVTITSYRDDSVGGDTNGDGAATAPAAADWQDITFDTASSALRTPVSVLDYTKVRYGGYGTAIPSACQVGMIRTLSKGVMLVVSNSEITDSARDGLISTGLGFSGPPGFVGVYNSHFARSACGLAVFGGPRTEVIGNTFEASMSSRGFYGNSPNQVRIQFNTFSSSFAVAGTPRPTRASADVRYNAFLGDVGYPVLWQNLDDYSLNWWARDLNEPLPNCIDTRADYMPEYTYESDSTACPGMYMVVPTGYKLHVLPALSAGPGTLPEAIGAAAAPTFGPVNTVSGAVTYTAQDITVQDAGRQFTAARIYRSDGSGGDDLGPGWSTSYSEALSTVTGTATMSLADGRSITFGTDPAAGYVPQPGVSSSYSTDSSGSTITAPDQTGYRFNPAGQLTAVQLGDLGHQLSIDRSGSGELTKITGISGRWLSYTRSVGRLSSIADSTGRAVSFEYDSGRLTAATGVDGNTHTYTYDASGRLTTVTTPLGRTELAVEYRADGRAAWVEQRGSGRATFGYDPANQRTTVTLADGTVLAQSYDGQGRLVTDGVQGRAQRQVVYDAEGRSIVVIDGVPASPMANYGPAANAVLYDGAGDPIQQLDPLGRVTITTFNAQHNALLTTYPDASTISRTYDGAGRLSTLIDQGGKSWQYTFNGHGQITARTDPLTRTASWTYAGNGDLTAATDETAAVTSYGADPQGRVISITDPLSRTRLVGYTSWDVPNQLTLPRGGVASTVFDADRQQSSSTTPGNATTTYAYDPAGRVSVITDALGGASTVHYDQLGRVDAVTDARGGLTSRSYSPEGWVTQLTDPTSAMTATLSDPAGRPIRITDALGQVTQTVYNRAGESVILQTPDGKSRSYGYDELGRQSTATAPTGGVWKQAYDPRGWPTVTTDPNNKTITVGYDSVGRPTSRTDQVGVTTSATFDDAARTVTLTDPIGTINTTEYDAAGQTSCIADGRGAATVYTYNADGNLAGTTTPTGAQTAYTYDLAGQLTTTTDPLNHATGFEYDPLGRITTKTWPGGAVQAYGYDPAGNLTTLTDRAGHEWTITYDGAGNPLTSTDPLGHATSYQYDPLHRLTTTTDATGVVQATAYDPAGRPAVVYDATDASWVTTFDGNGNQLTRIDPAGVTVSNTYDNLDRLTKTVGNGVTVTYGYDANGRPTTLTKSGKTWTTEYDARGRTTATTDPLSARTAYGYDAADNQISVTTPTGRTSTISYALDGRVSGAADPLGNQSGYTYDAAGQLTVLTLPGGGSYNYTYDAAGRLASQTTPGAAGATQYGYDPADRLTSTTYASNRVVTNNYDAAGNLSQTTAGADTRSYGYDTANRLTSAASNGATLGFGYDNRGLLTSASDASGTTTFGYDAASRLGSYSAPAATATYAYDTSGRLSQVRGATNLNYTYDSSGRLASRTAATGTSTKHSENYTYDNADRLTRISSTGYTATGTYTPDGQVASLIQTATGNPASNTTTYGYDAAGRLTTAQLSRNNQIVATTTYGWDADNNRTSIGTTEQPTQTATFNTAGQLTALTGGYSYTYDPDGRLTQVDQPGAPTQATYTYNGFGELTATTTAGAAAVGYTRDALGRIASRSDGTTTAGVYYDGTTTAVAGYGTPTATSRLIRDPHGVVLVATTPNQPTQHAHTNIHGDLAEWADETTGTITASTIFDPFGQPSTTGTHVVPLGFQSMLTDTVTGLVDMGSRQYQPSQGRFTTLDSHLGDPTRAVTLNRYAYGNADPVSLIDPDGHCSLNPFSGDDCYSQAADTVRKTVANAVATVTDTAKTAARTVKSTVSQVTSWVSSNASTALDSVVGQARGVVNNVVAHGTRIADNLQHSVNQIAHDPQQAIAVIGSATVGAVVFGGCEALTAGAGSVACLTLAGAAAGGVYGASTCTDGQAILNCAGKGAIAGAAGAATLAITGGIGGAALAGATGDATNQLLNTCGTGCHIDIDQTITAGITTGALGRTPGLGRTPTNKTPTAAKGVDDGVDLYRHVSPGELADIGEHGFRPGPNSLGGKWFAESGDHASEWGRVLNNGEGAVVKVRVPGSFADQLMRLEKLDGIGPARYVEPHKLDMLNRFGWGLQ